MASHDQRQALIVYFDIATGVKTTRRVWYTPSDATIMVTIMQINGRMYRYRVEGGVIVERTGPFDYNAGERNVGPPITYMWPHADGTVTQKTLRRNIGLTDLGAESEGFYYDMDPALPGAFGAPYKRFVTDTRGDFVNNDNHVATIYDFEERSICSWDPRRDGVGAFVTKPMVIANAVQNVPAWHFIPWGDGDGQTALSVGITAAETIIFVENNFVLPQTPPWDETIDDGLFAEDVRVTAQEGNKLTIVRGQNGTQAIPHESGALFQHKIICDDTPQDEPAENVQTVPWPAGQALAEKMLAKLQNPVRRLTVQIVNRNDEWAKVRPGSVLSSNIQTEGPSGGITGNWRVLGWAPNYHAGTMELMIEEQL